MTSIAKVIANVKNAAMSTGPRSPQGKSISSQNSIKHGFSACFRVLPHESQQEYDHLLADFQITFEPSGAHQKFCVGRMAESQWLLARTRRIEVCLVDRMSGVPAPPDNPDAVIADHMLTSCADPFGAIQRYAAAAERSYYRAHRELEQDKKRNREAVQNEPKVPEPPPAEISCPVDLDPLQAIHDVGQAVPPAMGSKSPVVPNSARSCYPDPVL